MSKKFYSFPSPLLNMFSGKKRVSAIIAPRSAGKSTTNYTQIFQTPIKPSFASTPIGTAMASVTTLYGTLRMQAAAQHHHQMAQALYFGAATTISNLYPKQSPFMAAIRGVTGNTTRPSHITVDDPDFNFLEHRAKWDSDYYEDKDIHKHDLEGYVLVKPDNTD